METSLPVINTVVVKKKIPHEHSILISSCTWNGVSMHRLTCAQSLITKIIWISYQPLYTDDHTAVKWCRWGNLGLVPTSNQWPSGVQSSEPSIPQCIFYINQPESGCQNSKR